MVLHLRAQDLGEGDEHPHTLSHGVWLILRYLFMWVVLEYWPLRECYCEQTADSATSGWFIRPAVPEYSNLGQVPHWKTSWAQGIYRPDALSVTEPTVSKF